MKKFAILLLLILALPAFARVPKKISVQGVLHDNTGKLATGTHVLQLNLYDALTGGTLLYSDIESASLDNGVYSVLLGNQIAIPDSLLFDRPYYLGIAIDNGSELNPRVLLTPSPTAFYAIHAGTADSAATARNAAPVGSAGGDLSGSYPTPVVSAIGSHPISSATPALGQTLEWDGSQWRPSSGSAIAFCVIGNTSQTFPAGVRTAFDFNIDNQSGAFDDKPFFSLDSDSFTAPVDGYYSFDLFATFDTRAVSTDAYVYLFLYVNGSSVAYRRYYTLATGGYTQVDYTQLLKLKAGDHVQARCNPVVSPLTTVGASAPGNVLFSGFKLGN